jgi:hypothetical protein
MPERRRETAPTGARMALAPSAAEKGKESTRSFPFSVYGAPGACGKTRVVLHNLRPKPERRGGGAWPNMRW